MVLLVGMEKLEEGKDQEGRVYKSGVLFGKH